MQNFRYIATSAFLILLATSSLTLSVSADSDRDEHKEAHHVEQHESHDDDHRQSHKKHKKIILKKSETQTGSTQKPVTPVKPVPTVSPKTPVKPTTATPTTSSSSVTHTSTISYSVPGGSASVVFSATVKNGVITAASSTTKAGGTSGYYQDAFAQKISSSVVGKKASTLSLSAIGGASLTTAAFSRFVRTSF